LAGASGNARTLTFTAGFNAARVTNTDKTSVYFSAIKASAGAGWPYDHNLTPRLFLNTFNDCEYDKFQSLDQKVNFKAN
jgi:Protein of unknown function, DUF481